MADCKDSRNKKSYKEDKQISKRWQNEEQPMFMCSARQPTSRLGADGRDSASNDRP